MHSLKYWQETTNLEFNESWKLLNNGKDGQTETNFPATSFLL